MSRMVSRWPILLTLAVDASDRDDEGRLTDAAVERLFAIARAAYFDRCHTLDTATSEIVETSIVRGPSTVTAGSVTVSVAVIEVFPESFTMAARIRRQRSDEIVADARCSVQPSTGVTDSIRDELIALAHGAEHFH